MYITFEWLNDYLDMSVIDGQDLSEKMSRTGLEIESVVNLSNGLSGLVVGQVLDCQSHPESDHLKITQVDIGQDAALQIVCGAPNVSQGQKVIVAVPGATLPGNLTIQETELRGKTSQGMICSLQEIGFPDNVVPKKYANGIFVLTEDVEVGMSVIDLFKLDDPILEVDLTPNRADALSVRGIVYEVAAILNQKVDFTLTSEASSPTPSGLFNDFILDIPNPDLSPHFTLKLVDGVMVQESPIWLQVRLMKMGIRPINNIVDITNYIMLLYGQPLHAYDFEKLPSQHLGVRLAQDGEKLVTLDGVERLLTEEDLVIISGNQPIGLAGVMGGLDTEVTEETRTVLIESAIFNQSKVRKTSKKYNLRSQASLRNEKGLNKATVLEANEVAGKLMAELGQGKVDDQTLEYQEGEIEKVSITIPYHHIESKLGIKITKEELMSIFQRLNFKTSYQDEDFTVEIPERRWDIFIEADILEEIARIYGYDKIPARLPKTTGQPGILSQKQKFIRRTHELLEGLGLNQVISYILTSKEKANLLKSQEYPLVNLALPLSEDRTTLRQSMFPALLEVAQFNRARQANHIAIYETGKVFFGQGMNQQPLEKERIAIMVSGLERPNSWFGDETNYDFYSLKGILETYFDGFRLNHRISYQAQSSIQVMHPGRSADILFDGESIGFLGQVHPSICKEYDLPLETFFMEMSFDRILGATTEAMIQQPIPKHPSSARDIAIEVSQDQRHAEIVTLIEQKAGPYLKSVQLFDKYVGDKLGSGKQSLAYRLTFQNPEDTLRDEDIQESMEQVIEGLQQLPDVVIR